ncbi:MAG: CPBP family intramembrane glutamic endopeptidase [Pseudomonadota bacterium]|nr:CPBP family intramembrane glutamic endopeptidase [Pseudomonadota bacterium]
MSASPARSRAGLLAELAILVTVLVGTKLIFDPIVWRYAGPISLLCTLIVLAAVARLRRESWRDFGLVPLRGWKSRLLIVPQALLGMAAIIASGAAAALGGDALGLWSVTEGEAGIGARFGDMQGNLSVYLGWVALAWTSAAFGEEIFFRGYLINRFGEIFPKIWWGTALAVLLPAIGFGAVHMYYQGVRGLVTTGLIGLAMGALYIAYKRNLWPLVIAHGAVNTLSFTAIYLDLDM